MLLPESEAKQCNGETQEPGTQRREESARSAGSESSSKSERKATTDRSDGTQDRHQRGRHAGPLFHGLPSCRASSTARWIISDGGRPADSDPEYKRQLSAKLCAFSDSPATSRPLIRIVGEPRNLRLLAIPSSRTSTSWISVATPFAARIFFTSLTAAGCDGHSATYKTSTFNLCSPVSMGFFLAKSDNARAACAVHFCNCAVRIAVRVLACAGRQVSAEHRPAFLAVGAAPGRMAASDSLAGSIAPGSR